MECPAGFDYGTDNIMPEKEYKTARSLRVSPLYTRAAKAGAVFGENVGFERALYFTSNSPQGELGGGRGPNLIPCHIFLSITPYISQQALPLLKVHKSANDWHFHSQSPDPSQFSSWYLPFGFLCAGWFSMVEESLNMQPTRYGKPHYFDTVKTEYWGCRENVCVVDMSSFSKTEIRVSIYIHALKEWPWLSGLSA